MRVYFQRLSLSNAVAHSIDYRAARNVESDVDEENSVNHNRSRQLCQAGETGH